jgi:hypothetical protein
MKTRVTLVAASILLSTAPVMAAPQAVLPALDVRAETTEGEVHVTLVNAEYVKVELNGQAWENIEFEKDGKLLLVKGLDSTLERNALTLRALDETLAPVEIDVLGTSFKKTRVKKEFHLISKQTAKFEKAKAPEPEPAKAPEPEPAKAP